MTSVVLLQIGLALVIAATPWFVVRTAIAAARHAGPAGTRAHQSGAARVLDTASAIAALGLGAAAFRAAPPSLALAIGEGGVFLTLATVGFVALRDVDRMTRSAREISTPRRSASLSPRRVGAYLPLLARLLPGGVLVFGLTAFAYRLSGSLVPRRLLMPVGFAFAALVFLALYELWIRQEVSGGQIAEGESIEVSRRRRVRSIYSLEVVLVAGFVLLSHALLNLDWTVHSQAGMLAGFFGGVLGVVGCARAVSSDLAARRYSRYPDRGAQ